MENTEDTQFHRIGEFYAKLEEASGDWYPYITLNGEEVDDLPNAFDPFDTSVISWVNKRDYGYHALVDPSTSRVTRARGFVYRNALGVHRYVVDYVEVTTTTDHYLCDEDDLDSHGFARHDADVDNLCVFEIAPVTQQ